MKLKRIVSKKTNRIGFRGRYIDPLTGQRMQQTFWFAERADAEKAVQALLSRRQKREFNIPDESGWKVPYSELVTRFLTEGAISTPERLKRLSSYLSQNLLKISVCGEFSGRGVLTAKCKTLALTRGEVFVNKCVIQPVKQLSAWAAEMEITPHDPLQAWKKLARKIPLQRKLAFTPEEIRAVFSASDELDALNGCRFQLSMAFKTLLLTGNRPGAVSRATVGDFDEKRIHLPPGRGKKHNGAATIPAQFVAEFQRYFLMRGRPESEEPLLVSGEGKKLDGRNLRDGFKRAVTLAFVKMCWPAQDTRTEHAKPLEVALSIHNHRIAGFGGPPPKDDAKKAMRAKRKAAIEALTEMLKPLVEKRVADRPVYALRHTHITWARRFANFDAVRAQVGHAGRNIEEQHYNDAQFVDAALSSQAVWEVLTGAKQIQRTENASSEAISNQNATVVATVGKEVEKSEQEPAQEVAQVQQMQAVG